MSENDWHYGNKLSELMVDVITGIRNIVNY